MVAFLKISACVAILFSGVFAKKVSTRKRTNPSLNMNPETMQHMLGQLSENKMAQDLLQKVTEGEGTIVENLEGVLGKEMTDQLKLNVDPAMLKQLSSNSTKELIKKFGGSKNRKSQLKYEISDSEVMHKVSDKNIKKNLTNQKKPTNGIIYEISDSDEKPFKVLVE